LRKKGSEFAQLRIYSENQLLRNKPKICRICRTVLCVCVVLLASPVPPILLLLLLLVVVVGRGASMCNH
jgi:hypothetical protein